MLTDEPIPPPLPGTSDKSFGQKLKAAGQIASKQALKAKLTTVDLPNVYKVLGRQIYASKAFQEDLKPIYDELASYSTQLKKIKADATARPAAEGMSGKAKAAAIGLQDQAALKAVELRTSQVFRALGETAFAKFGERACPAELIAVIRYQQARVAALDVDIAMLSVSKAGSLVTPKRILVAASIFLALLVLGAVAGKNSDIKSDGGGTSGPSGSLPDNRAVSLEPQAAITIPAEQLETEYVDNEVAADDRYKGKSIVVVGTVSEIKKGFLGGKYIIIETGNVAREIQCDFTDDSGLAGLTRGQMVRVRGTCDVLMMYVHMKDCKLVGS